MDREKKEKRFAWLPSEMPGVARLMVEKRARYGDAWVAQCWKRGVVDREPNWFFAREGVLAIGTPFTTPELRDVANWTLTSTQCMVFMPEPPATAQGEAGK